MLSHECISSKTLDGWDGLGALSALRLFRVTLQPRVSDLGIDQASCLRQASQQPRASSKRQASAADKVDSDDGGMVVDHV